MTLRAWARQVDVDLRVRVGGDLRFSFTDKKKPKVQTSRATFRPETQTSRLQDDNQTNKQTNISLMIGNLINNAAGRRSTKYKRG